MSERLAPRGEGTTLRITLVRSLIGRPQDQRDTVRSLGLRKIRQTVERPDVPSIRGMVFKVRHLVRVEPGAGAEGNGAV